MGRIRECCAELDMKEYFWELCTRYENSPEIGVDERRAFALNFEFIHCREKLNDGRRSIKRYSKMSDTWTTIGYVEDSQYQRISIGREILTIFTYESGITKVQQYPSVK